MSIFNTQNFTATRVKVTLVDSEFVEGTPEVINFTGTMHAIPGEELKSLEVGREIIEGQVLITKEYLKTAEKDGTDNYKPDLITYLGNNKQYEVVKIMNAEVGIIPHNEYLLDIKKDNG